MTRRDLLIALKKLSIPAILIYPLYSFINTVQKRPPKEVRIGKVIKPGKFVINTDFVVFNGEKGFWAVSRKCTHLGCTLNYEASQKEFICPCHQSRFDQDGKYISGPAKKNLQLFEVERIKDGEGIVVKIPRGTL